MRLIDVATKINQLGLVIFTTNDIASSFQIQTSHATNLLRRLSTAGQLTRLAHGLWGLANKIEPLMLPEYLTAPMPSYISLQSALYYHGMISQIPEIIYAISIARTKVYKTPLATISIHHIQPVLFSDYIITGKNNIKIATPEKALFDFFYLRPAKNYLFRSLPEIELPDNFDLDRLAALIKKISYSHRRAMIEKSIARFW